MPGPSAGRSGERNQIWGSSVLKFISGYLQSLFPELPGYSVLLVLAPENKGIRVDVNFPKAQANFTGTATLL